MIGNHKHTRLQHDLNTLKRDLGNIKTDLEKISSSVVDEGKDTLHELRDKAHDIQDKARHHVDDGLKNARHHVRKQPLASTMIAAGAGFLLGSLFYSRR